MPRRRLTFLAFAAWLCGCGQILGLDHDARLIDIKDIGAACGNCDDQNPCTVDVCDTESGHPACVHAPAADGLAPDQAAGDCALKYCAGGRVELRVDDSDAPNDGLECTTSKCKAGLASTTFLPAGAVCQQGGGAVCNGSGQCVECVTDAQCQAPKRCGVAGQAGVCGCVQKTCGELGITCGPGPDGCGGSLDCDNGAIDGDESDIDCGGKHKGCETRCINTRKCRDASDCASGYCSAGECRDPWTSSVGGSGGEHATSVAVGPDGSVVVAGSFSSALKLGASLLPAPPNGQSIFVAKFSALGKPLWVKAFGSGAPNAGAVAIDSAGNIVLAGWLVGELSFAGNTVSATVPRGFALKLDGNGGALWADWLCGDSSSGCASSEGASKATAVALDAKNRAVLTGSYSGALRVWQGTKQLNGAALASSDADDVFVIALDTAGKPEWSTGLSGSGTATPAAVACAAERIAIGGDFQGALSGGDVALSSHGGRDMFVATFDLAGKTVFGKRFGSDQSQSILKQHLSAVAIDTKGELLLAGDLVGEVDFGGGARKSKGEEDLVVAKLSATGEHLWSHAFGDGNSQHAAGIALDTRGNVFVVGSFEDSVPLGLKTLTSLGGFDVLALQLDAQGAVTYANNYGDAATQYGRAVASSGFGGVVMVGDYFGSIDFGKGKITASGANDVFIAALAP